MTPKTANTLKMTQAEIRRAGFQALLERLGPAGTIRFLRQYDPGQGDYTKDRHLWLEAIDVEQAIVMTQQRQSPT